MPPAEAVGRLQALLGQRSQRIAALDLAVAAPGGIIALSQFDSHPEYYRLHRLEEDGFRAVCSQPLASRGWMAIPVGAPVELTTFGR